MDLTHVRFLLSIFRGLVTDSAFIDRQGGDDVRYVALDVCYYLQRYVDYRDYFSVFRYCFKVVFGDAVWVNVTLFVEYGNVVLVPFRVTTTHEDRVVSTGYC